VFRPTVPFVKAVATTLVLLVAAANAAAADDPGTFATAQRGSLKVVSGVMLSLRGGEMKGVWLDRSLSCRVRRQLRVTIQIDLVRPSGATSRVRQAKTGLVDNCAEGGPNFGFDLVARRLGFGCADGRWRPGRYAMTTTTTHVASGLRASASLYRQVTRPC
jgi:hypothetical protein